MKATINDGRDNIELNINHLELLLLLEAIKLLKDNIETGWFSLDNLNRKTFDCLEVATYKDLEKLIKRLKKTLKRTQKDIGDVYWKQELM